MLACAAAQLALLEGNQAVYDTSIKEALSWVADGFDAEDEASIAMSTALGELAGREVSVVLPDISASLAAARDRLRSFHEADDQ